jgi:hypothetical protein
MANVMKQRNFIQTLFLDNGLDTTQQEKHKIIYDHYIHHIGSYVPRSCSLNLTDLQWEPKDLHHLDVLFIDQEIKSAIFNSPREKALGLDVYIGLFFISCWNIIKQDLVRAMEQFYLLNQHGLHFLN